MWNHESLGFCFDMGHFNLFGQTRTLPDYLSYFKGLIGHVHIHDNNGKADQHLPPGLGTIDFDPLIEFLKTEHQPWSLTVEGKTFDHNEEATNFVRSNFPLFTAH